MRFIPNTEADCRLMREAIGVSTIDDLFADIPEAVRLKRPLDVPPAHSEQEVVNALDALSRANASTAEYASFLGAGAYNHFVPAVVKHLTGRGEFATAYTPYQPEIAQGTLQAIFEFQSLICQLTAMDVANASMYDGASALAEAVLMAHRLNNRAEVLLPATVHPEYRQVVSTYTHNLGLTLHTPAISSNGRTDLDAVCAQISDNTSSLVVQYPNFFGVIEDLADLADLAHQHGALCIVAVPEPVALGLLAPPGQLGADIVVGEGQAFGNQLQYGGPYVGFFAIKNDPKNKIVRKMPGRLVGATTDVDGRRGFVLTLATREQHIKREKATSNICTNEALCALACTIYLSTLGKTGLRELACLNFHKAEYAKRTLCNLDDYDLLFDSPTFNEFAVKTPGPVAQINQRLLEQKILGGVDLGRDYPDYGDAMLLCVTEHNTKAEIDRLADALQGAGSREQVRHVINRVANLTKPAQAGFSEEPDCD